MENNQLTEAAAELDPQLTVTKALLEILAAKTDDAGQLDETAAIAALIGAIRTLEQLIYKRT